MFRDSRLVLLFALGTSAFSAACDGCGDDTEVATTASGGSAGAGGLGTGGTAGSGALVLNGGSGGLIGDELTVVPPTATITVDGTAQTFDFDAELGGAPAPNGVVWSAVPDLAGYVDSDGVFHASGFASGKADITAALGELSGVGELTVVFDMIDNVGGLSQDDIDALRAGGSADPQFAWLYPYDRTVFPRGLAGPTMQLAGLAADATYVKVSFENYTYEGFFGPSSPTRIDLPEQVWEGITLSATATDDVEISVTKMSGGQVTGPVTQSFRIAQGSLKGVIYYNTYNSGGAVKRIRPGQPGETFISGCPVCHSVSSKGTVLAAGVSWSNGDPIDSDTFDLNPDGSNSVRYSDPEGRKFPFAGLTPDGDLALGSAVPPTGPRPRGLSGDYPSKLWNTATGAEVIAPSFTDLVPYAVTPNFAHDGTLVAFTNQDGTGKNLSIMGVNLAVDPPVFSGLEQVVTAQGAVAAWPSFLPDSAGLLYHDGERFDTQQSCNGASYANIRLVDLATKQVKALDRLNGYDGGSFYLPFGEAEEADVNYEPSVLPVPVGGYYWVIFTSRRAYGNYLGPGGTAGGASKWGTCNPEVPSPRKKLWIAAIDTDWSNIDDPSHPAFYLPGQEIDTGNMRAFAALEPCKELDEPCEYGFECCDGKQCLPTGDVDEEGKPIKACQDAPVGDCSPVGGSCETAADCCDTTNLCINGFCALQSPK